MSSNPIIGWIITALKEVVKDPDVTKWVDDRIAGAVKAGESAIALYAQDMENKLIAEIEKLPAKIIGNAEDDVKGLLGVVPGQVKDQMSPLFAGLQGVLDHLGIPGIPGFPNIFGGR